MDHTKARDSHRRNSRQKRPVRLGFANASNPKTRRFVTARIRVFYSPNSNNLLTAGLLYSSVSSRAERSSAIVDDVSSPMFEMRNVFPLILP